MKNRFKIIDESGDRKYFTIVPNYIVNHSTPYEQAIYLYMKRVAGEAGTCWMSAQSIGKRLGISRSTVSIYREKLLERGWIEIVGIKETGLTKQKTPEYKIVDLWDLNTKFYKDKGKVSAENTFDKVSAESEKVSLKRQKVSPKRHKEEPYKKNQEEDSNASVAVINPLIDLFKTVNPSWDQLFARPPQRKAIERLLKKFGEEKLRQIINYLPKSNASKYAPVITTPVQLENKLGDLSAFFQKERSQREIIGIAI